MNWNTLNHSLYKYVNSPYMRIWTLTLYIWHHTRVEVSTLVSPMCVWIVFAGALLCSCESLSSIIQLAHYLLTSQVMLAWQPSAGCPAAGEPGLDLPEQGQHKTELKNSLVGQTEKCLLCAVLQTVSNFASEHPAIIPRLRESLKTKCVASH